LLGVKEMIWGLVTGFVVHWFVYHRANKNQGENAFGLGSKSQRATQRPTCSKLRMFLLHSGVLWFKWVSTSLYVFLFSFFHYMFLYLERALGILWVHLRTLHLFHTTGNGQQISSNFSCIG
jgi:hypothetical protein